MKSKRKVALITGGAKGIGAAISKRLANEAYDLHIAYFQSVKEYESLKGNLTKKDVFVSGSKADLRIALECKKVIDECIKAHGKISALILNAGVFTHGDPIEISIEEWETLIQTNLSSSVYMLKYGLPLMRKQGGSIIFIGTGSIADSHPAPKYPLYAASKAGMYVLMRSLAVNEGQYGIRVNMVSPGMIDAGQYKKETVLKYEKDIPLGRLGKSDDVASAVSFLLSDDASYISGANIDVSGGWVRK